MESRIQDLHGSVRALRTLNSRVDQRDAELMPRSPSSLLLPALSLVLCSLSCSLSVCSCFPSDTAPHAFFKCRLRRGPYSPEAPQQAPFAPAHTVLTEKTHLPCIVKNFINSNLCHSGLCTERKHLGLVQIYHSSCQKNLFSCNMNRPRVCGQRDGICFWEGDGLAVQRLPVKQVTLFTSRSLNHKQMFYLRKKMLFTPLLSCLPLPPGCACVFSTFDCFKHPERKQKHSWQEALPCHVKEQIGRHEAKWTNCTRPVY